MIAVERYSLEHRAEWNAFAAAAKNHVFFFDRGYLEYHGERFPDHSLIFRLDGVPVALLPATVAETTLSSHAGLSFGGLVVGDAMTQLLMMDVFGALVEYMHGAGLRVLQYKTIPYIYHRRPAEEDRFALARCGAVLSRRDVNSVVRLDRDHGFSAERLTHLEHARRSEVDISEGGDLVALWEALEKNLWARYQLRPVHSLAEIDCLRRRFPEQIRVFTASRRGRFLAGVVVFESNCVAHAQYTANSAKGRVFDALDVLFSDLLKRYSRVKPFFSFGVSSYDDGRELNVGLVSQKEAFGARTIVHDHYVLTLEP